MTDPNKSLGVEFDSNRLNYVLVERTASGETVLLSSGKLVLDESRDADAMRRFSSSVKEMLAETAPVLLSIKAKPENGQMRAGASALKMEAIVLAQSSCEVYFLSAQRVDKAAGHNDALYAYQQGAWKAAVAAFDGPPKKPSVKKPRQKPSEIGRLRTTPIATT